MTSEPSRMTNDVLAAQVGEHDTRWAKALSHPVRAHAMRILTERVASPSDIARELELPVANVSYHVNTLLRLRCIEEVEHRHVRGAIEHLYRAVQRPILWSDQWSNLSQGARDDIVRAWLETVANDFEQGVETGALSAGDPDHHLTRTPLRLDAEAFSQIARRLEEILQWSLELQAESAVRLANGAQGGPEVSSRLVMAHFAQKPGSS
jgi:DNA-binding transcriptional ArsR family regulator